MSDNYCKKLRLYKKALVYYKRAKHAGLIGSKFASFGRDIAKSLIRAGMLKTGFDYLLTPVNIVRYFEFAFVDKSIDWNRTRTILDVSSPCLFPLYAIMENKTNVTMINMDKKDIESSEAIFTTLKLEKMATFQVQDATRLNFPDDSFDVVTSISVIEHISGNGDSLALKEMWRVLKPGGRLIVTVPFAPKYRDEYKTVNVWGLPVEKMGEYYFFQRWYDMKAVEERLCTVIDAKPIEIEFFGEKITGTYDAYAERWIARRNEETIMDPVHIVTDYTFYDRPNDVVGASVAAVMFEKGQ